jgi:hypothetical protein
MSDKPLGYELWDGLSANMVMDFDTEDEALTFVRGEIVGLDLSDQRYRFMQAWVLIEVNADGKPGRTVAEGEELLERARKAGR